MSDQEERRDDHPIQTDSPESIQDEREVIEAALEELEHFMWRADTDPLRSTLDPNLRRAEDHLKYYLRVAEDDADE